MKSFNITKVSAKNILVSISMAVVLSAVIYIGYQQGIKSEIAKVQKPSKEQGYPMPEAVSKKTMAQMDANLKALQARLDFVEQRSQKTTTALDSVKQTTVAADIEAMEARLTVLSERPQQKNVPLPADSVSAKVINQPKGKSGIPVSTLASYEKETGVSAARIEELMQRSE